MKKIDTNELRAQLDTFSPEQQRDEDRALLNENINAFRTLSGVVERSVNNFKNISAQVDASIAQVEKILPDLKAANTVRVDGTIMTTIEKAAAQLGDNVAETFAKKVRTVLDDVNDVSGRVSCPVNIAITYILVMNLSILLLIMVVVANITIIHSGVLWGVLGGGFGMEILILLFVWYLHRKGWV